MPNDQRTGSIPPRIEPSLDESGSRSNPNNVYEKLHGIGPDFGEYSQPERSRLWRITLMLGVFIFGAGVGLAAAWWLQYRVPNSPPSATSSSAVRIAPEGDVKRTTTIRGISPSELPYDGAPPPASMQSTAAPDTASVIPTGPDIPSNASEPAQRNEAASSSRASTTANAEQDVPAEKPAARAAMVSSQAERDSGKSMDAGDAVRAGKANRQSNENTASAAPKRRNSARASSDREIERIRRQVEEELKKKTEHGRAPGSAGNGAHFSSDRSGNRKIVVSKAITREAATRAQLAKCDRNSNFIRRELCRWRICNGSWGQFGCPSYPPHTPSY